MLETHKFHTLKTRLIQFVDADCIPAEHLFYSQMGQVGSQDRWKIVPPILETLKSKAKSLGLWNCFLSSEYGALGAGLSNRQYAELCEIMGKSILAQEATNCSAPDTGNMEVLAKYGNQQQKDQWLTPLLNGKIRSAFAMTEPAVASSDATNIETSILPDPSDPNYYIVNGRKWWISGAGDPRCKLFIVMGKSDPTHSNKHAQQSVILVAADTPGIVFHRPMTVFGYDDAPHGHMDMSFNNVRVPASNLILGPGRGFEIIQGRLGPGRIHHCMRQIGVAERALECMLLRVTDPARKTFGKMLWMHGSVMDAVAKSRIEIDAGRALVLKAAESIDRGGAKAALKEIAMAKVYVPEMTCRVIDRAIQAHGAGGIGQDFPLAYMYAASRTLRIADGPDEVHLLQIAKSELGRVGKGLRAAHEASLSRQKQISASSKL